MEADLEAEAEVEVDLEVEADLEAEADPEAAAHPVAAAAKADQVRAAARIPADRNLNLLQLQRRSTADQARQINRSYQSVSHNLPQELDQQVADHSPVQVVVLQHQQMQTHPLQHLQTHQPLLRKKKFQLARAQHAEAEMGQMTLEFLAKPTAPAAPPRAVRAHVHGGVAGVTQQGHRAAGHRARQLRAAAESVE